MSLDLAVITSLRKVSNGFWISRSDGMMLCALKLAELGPVHGFVLTQAGLDALRSSPQL
jgi:hypothetical protein